MNIQAIRKEKGLTQKELAEAVGVTTTIISRYENGSITPPTDKLLKIAEKLDVSVNDLLSGNIYSSPYEFMRQFEKECYDVTRRHFSSLPNSIPVPVPGDRDRKLPFFELVSSTDEKTWCFSLLGYPHSPEEARDSRRIVISRIGSAAFFPGINKLSIISNIPVERLLNSLPGIPSADHLGFDVSIIHFNVDEQRLDNEFDLVTHFDGRGYFDLTVPGKEAESARLFAAWKASLSAKPCSLSTKSENG